MKVWCDLSVISMIDFEITIAFLSILTIITLWQTDRDLLSQGVGHYRHFTEDKTGKYNGQQLTDTSGHLHSSKTSNRKKRCNAYVTAHGSRSRQHLDKSYLASLRPLNYVHFKYPAMYSMCCLYFTCLLKTVWWFFRRVFRGTQPGQS